MRRRLVSLAAILAVIAPASSVWALSPDTGSAPAAVVSAPALSQAAPLQGALSIGDASPALFWLP